jgi:hypothetical protein
MGTAIALWSSAVALSYAASLWGRPTFGRRLADTTSHGQAVRCAFGVRRCRFHSRERRRPRRPVAKAATEKGLVGLAVLARKGKLRNEANLPTRFCWRTATDHVIDRISARDCRSKSCSWRRCSMASRVNCPCFSAFLLPRGAPEPSAPPCIRQCLFPLTAGDMQGLPERVFAPQRRLESISGRASGPPPV